MLDRIQLILTLQVVGFCIFGGMTLLLRARENRAKRILGWNMFLWAFLASVRLSVNWYIEEQKEVFNQDILITGCLVTASLACYVIEVIRPGYLTWRRFATFISPVFIGGFAYGIYRLAGGEVHVYYSIPEFFHCFNADAVLRLLILFITLLYMLVPAYLVLRYSKEFTTYLRENVSDPESYDFVWLRKIMIILSVMYLFYLALLCTNNPLIYVIDKTIILFVWYYFFYKGLFLKTVPLGTTFKSG